MKIDRILPGNLQVHWPEGNVLIRHGVVEPKGGVPDYNAWVRIEHEGATRKLEEVGVPA